ncbi:MAG: hypothetical protein NVS9B8_16410 [Candidatus Limnocylindrales bacterium]
MMGAMDHSEVRDLLEAAAIEPGGHDRLMAGDTTTAARVAGHLAGCRACADELERLRRSVGLIRPTIRSMAPPDLRNRTLAYVAAVGRPRGPAVVESAPAAGPTVNATDDRRAQRALLLRRRWPAVAAVAAALIVAVSGTALVVSVNRAAAARTQAAQIEALGEVARWTARVDAQPDVRRISLASATGGPSRGSLVFSPTSTELVVVADGLTPAPAGREYRCWIEIGTNRSSIGKMFFGGTLAYWVGAVPQVSGLPADVRFGVSLVDLGRTATPGDPVLVGPG